jgi:hypothetical protein
MFERDMQNRPSLAFRLSGAGLGLISPLDHLKITPQ